MFKKDRFIWGLLAGLILPALACIYESVMNNSMSNFHRSKIVYLISIALNLILVRVAYRTDLERTGRGLMFITFLAAIAMFYFKIGL